MYDSSVNSISWPRPMAKVGMITFPPLLSVRLTDSMNDLSVCLAEGCLSFFFGAVSAFYYQPFPLQVGAGAVEQARLAQVYVTGINQLLFAVHFGDCSPEYVPCHAKASGVAAGWL